VLLCSNNRKKGWFLSWETYLFLENLIFSVSDILNVAAKMIIPVGLDFRRNLTDWIAMLHF
jgi:hypothetical protein